MSSIFKVNTKSTLGKVQELWEMAEESQLKDFLSSYIGSKEGSYDYIFPAFLFHKEPLYWVWNFGFEYNIQIYPPQKTETVLNCPAQVTPFWVWVFLTGQPNI